MLVSAVAASTLSESAAIADPVAPSGHYCITYFDGGDADCSFTSYARCQATASGRRVECYGDTTQDDEADRGSIPHW
jgi:hypothetical protein